MECERLKKLVKNWYVQVQGESMAPARMVDFMRNHVADCLTCMADPGVEIEVKRITEIVLPPAKIPKAVRKEKEKAKAEAEAEEESAVVGTDDAESEDVDQDGDVDPDDPDAPDEDPNDEDDEI